MGVRPAWLVGLVVFTGAVVWWLMGRGATPWIFPDELIYSEMAKSLAEGRAPAVRETTSFAYGLGYPLLLAPAWALTSDVPAAYEVAKAVNALVMASTAVPVYLLARRFVTARSAVVVAALAVLAPSMAYAGTLMTEVALYPAFVWAVYLMARALERPTTGRQIAVLAAIGAAVVVKSLAVVLLPAFLSSALLLTVLERGRGAIGRTARAYMPTLVITFALLLAAVGAAAVRGSGPGALLGAYSVALEHLDPLTFPARFLGHLAVLDVYVLAIPAAAAALAVVRGIRRGASSETRMFAALVIPAAVWTVTAVAWFSSEPIALDNGFFLRTVPLRERSVFMLVPLILIGAALFFREGVGSRRARLLAVTAGVATLAFLPWGELPRAVNPQNLSVIPFAIISESGWIRGISAAGMVAAVGLLWAASRAFRERTAWLLVLTWFVLVGPLAAASFQRGAELTADAGLPASRTWIDDAVPEGASVAVLWREPKGVNGFALPDKTQSVVFAGEFFNRSVGRVYSLGNLMPYELADELVRRRGRLVVHADGSPLVARYVLTRCPAAVVGTVVARGPAGAQVTRTSGTVELSPRGC